MKTDRNQRASKHLLVTVNRRRTFKRAKGEGGSRKATVISESSEREKLCRSEEVLRWSSWKPLSGVEQVEKRVDEDSGRVGCVGVG